MQLKEIIPLGNSQEFSAITVTWFLNFKFNDVEKNGLLRCSFCHLDFVKELPRFGRKISAKIGANLG